MNASAPTEVHTGEIIPPGEGLRVIVVPHPLLLRGRTVLEQPAGITIEEAVELTARGPHGRRWRWVAYLEGQRIPSSAWRRVRPKPGTTLIVQAVAGEGYGRQIALIVVAIAALVIAPWFAGNVLGFAAGTIGLEIATSVIAAGITIGGTLAINALFPVAAPQLGEQPGETLSSDRRPSITGGRNEAVPYGHIPQILGQTRTYPRLAARAFTEVVGHEQYLRMLLVWGYGPLDIDDIKIGETPIENFEDVEIETFHGYSTDDAPSLFPTQAFEEQLSIELEPEAAYVRVTSADIDEIIVDLTAPAGLFYQNKADGKRSVRTVEIGLRYRAYPGGGAWTNWTTHAFGENSTDVVRRGLRKKVSRGQYEVEVTRLTGIYDGDANNVQEAIYWTALKGFRNDPPIAFDAAPLAITALRIKASSQLSGSIDRVNGIVRSRVLAFNGSSWVPNTGSRNPANLFRHVLQGAANASPVPDARIDIDALEEWRDYCETEGFTYDAEITSGSVEEAAQQIAAAGRALKVFVDGKWSVAWDRPEAPVVWHFTPRNSWDFKGLRTYARRPHALRVRFLNEEKGYAEDERVVYDDGYNAGNATRFESVEFPGVTNPDLVWRHARFHIAQARLRPEIYELSTDFEQLRLVKGDRVRLTHDASLIGQASGRVKAIAGALVTLDETIIMETGKSYGIRFRLATGESLYRTVSLSIGEKTQVTLSGSGDVPEPGDLFAFGEAALESILCRVASISPRADMAARIRLVDDAAAISSADEGTIPAFNSSITLPPDPFTLPPRDLKVSEFFSALTGGIRSGVYLSWTVPRTGTIDRYEVQYRPEDYPGWKAGPTISAPQADARIFDLEPGTFDFRVRAIFRSGDSSNWVRVSNIVLAGGLAPPPDVTTFRIEPTGDVATLTWNRVDHINVRGYEVRYSPNTSGVTWATAAALFDELIAGTSVQIVPRSGTYLVKAVSYQDVQSVNAKALITAAATLSSFNVVETVSESAGDSPPFSGIHDGTVFDDVRGGLRIDRTGDFFEPADFFDQLGFFSGVSGTHRYQLATTLDLGQVFTSRVSSNMLVAGVNLFDSIFDRLDIFSVTDIFGDDPTVWEAYAEVRFTLIDPSGSPAGWSAWERLVARDYTARAFQFRVVLISRDQSITPLVSSVSFTVDMPDRVVADNNLVVTTAGRTVTFSPAYRALQGLAIVSQDCDTGDYWTVSAKDENGFTIIFRNPAGNPVERTFDYVAKGYGRVDN